MNQTKSLVTFFLTSFNTKEEDFYILKKSFFNNISHTGFYRALLKFNAPTFCAHFYLWWKL